MYRIGIDLGGTTVKAGVVDENNNIIEQAFAPTGFGRPAAEIVRDICTVAESAMNLCCIRKEECAGVGICSAGTCDPKTGRVVRSYNLGFFDVPVCDLVSFQLGLPAKLANDADAAALAEAVCTDLKEKSPVLFIGLGTGVGVGVIINGEIYSGCGRGGLEAGHMPIMMGGRACTCGEKGCFEAYASATALISQAKEAAAADPMSALNRLDQITGKAVFDTADAGDETAKAVVDRYIEYLSVGTASLINIFDPEAVVIGGGISLQGERLLAPVRDYAAKHIFGAENRTPPIIVPAVFGDSAGILGAAALVRQIAAAQVNSC